MNTKLSLKLFGIYYMTIFGSTYFSYVNSDIIYDPSKNTLHNRYIQDTFKKNKYFNGFVISLSMPFVLPIASPVLALKYILF